MKASANSIEQHISSLKTNVAVTTNSLAVYTGPWTKTEAAHLVRRTHFGLSINDLNATLSAGNSENAVNQILEKALNTPLPDYPGWFLQGPSSDILDMYDIQFGWMDSMVSGGLLDRMKLFWSNHFAVSYNNNNALQVKAKNSYANHMLNYSRTIERYAMGNVKLLVRSISKDPAMLYYLNNYVNSAENPNEDFARELLELFTLGPEDLDGSSNYTESDVSEVARAVTGWRVVEARLRAVFNEASHDGSNKTIFGKTAAFNLDTLIDLIYAERTLQSARFICKKIYSYFVSAEGNDEVVDQLAQHLVDNDFAIHQVLSRLFKSQHFYDVALVGCRIKSPVELFMTHFRELEIPPDTKRKEYIRIRMRQNSNEELLRPTTVFGWEGYNPAKSDNIPGHFAWLNTNYMPTRWQALSDLILVTREDVSAFNTIRLIEKISDPTNPIAIASDVAKHLFAVNLENVDIAPVEDAFAGDPAISPNLDGRSQKEIDLAKILLGPVPWYEWSVQTDASGQLVYSRIFDYLIRNYISYLVQLPAYQLI
jgi:hypothetical protein